MTIGSWKRWRRLAFAGQALVALGLPFLSVGGDSALRLDVPAGRLHAFGAAFAIDEAFVVLAATLLLTAAFLLVTLVLGRVWCGWACPQTVLGELTSWVAPERRSSPIHPERRARGARPKSKGAWRRPLGFLAVAAVSAIVGADLGLVLRAARRVPPPPRGRDPRAGGGRVLGRALRRPLPRPRLPARVLLRDGVPLREAAGRPLRPVDARRGLRRPARRGLRGLRGVRAGLPDRHRHPGRAADGVHRLRGVHRRLRADHGEAPPRAGPRRLLSGRARAPGAARAPRRGRPRRCHGGDRRAPRRRARHRASSSTSPPSRSSASRRGARPTASR